MCGIVGYIGDKQAQPILLSSSNFSTMSLTFKTVALLIQEPLPPGRLRGALAPLNLFLPLSFEGEGDQGGEDD